MKMRPGKLLVTLALAAAVGPAALRSQDAAAVPAQDEAKLPEQDAPARTRSIEGYRIINLPSAEVSSAGTLSMLFTHRFSQPLADSDWHDLWTFDSGAEIGIGIAYVPIRNLEVSFDRSSNQDDYEFAARYGFLAHSEKNPLSLALRLGADIRTEIGSDTKPSFFAQAIIAFSIGSRFRITAVPTFLTRTSGHRFIAPEEDVFNIPVAVAVGITRSINVQAEYTVRRGRYGSPGTGWIAAIEKTVLRHRFAFTVGNVRNTTADQYTVPDFFGREPKDYYIGFNLARSWKLM